jgi:hypothetical protein
VDTYGGGLGGERGGRARRPSARPPAQTAAAPPCRAQASLPTPTRCCSSPCRRLWSPSRCLAWPGGAGGRRSAPRAAPAPSKVLGPLRRPGPRPAHPLLPSSPLPVPRAQYYRGADTFLFDGFQARAGAGGGSRSAAATRARPAPLSRSSPLAPPRGPRRADVPGVPRAAPPPLRQPVRRFHKHPRRRGRARGHHAGLPGAWGGRGRGAFGGVGGWRVWVDTTRVPATAQRLSPGQTLSTTRCRDGLMARGTHAGSQAAPGPWASPFYAAGRQRASTLARAVPQRSPTPCSCPWPPLPPPAGLHGGRGPGGTQGPGRGGCHQQRMGPSCEHPGGASSGRRGAQRPGAAALSPGPCAVAKGRGTSWHRLPVVADAEDAERTQHDTTRADESEGPVPAVGPWLPVPIPL